MTHYRSNLKDIRFNLFDVLRVQDYYGSDPLTPVDYATAEQVLTEVERLASTQFAASFEEGDRVQLRLENGEVHLSPGVRKSIDAIYEGGWDLVSLPAELGGTEAAPSLLAMLQELLVGANPAVYFYLVGPTIAKVLYQEATAEQIDRFVRPAITRRWGATMVLTEPDAGSDVGAGVTRAEHIEGDRYHLNGVKRFITGGEEDYHENILHVVLARPTGAGPGTKGLSLFIVPKYMVNPDGTLGARNGVVATKLEEKMGIHASSTCELTFGLEQPCVGFLVGNRHDGIRQMFEIIKNARLTIGTKSASTLSTAYLNALEFAKSRVQGPDLAKFSDRNSPRVRIIEHPDVRRLLITQKAHAEGMRALIAYVGWAQDQSLLRPEDPYWAKLADLLLPLVKGYCSEKGYELLGQALQVLGGSGFTKDYPLEQYIRDAKIDTLYEGTTGIQALDLFFRKIARDQGATLTRLTEEIKEFAKAGGRQDPFSAERELLLACLEDLQGQVGAMVGNLAEAVVTPPAMYRVGLQVNSLLDGLSELVIGWLLLRHAQIAEAKLSGPGDKAFYEGKVASARFFARTVLPKAGLRRRLAEGEDAALMDLAEAAF